MTQAPEQGVRTTKLRRGRVTPGQAAARERLWPAFGVDPDGALDPPGLFGRTAPLVLEIGSGMGEATVALALAEPERDVLACELHTPGQGALLRRVEEAAVSNVRVVAGDGLRVLELLPPRSLAVVRVFFPDPWPKARHRKRRLVDETFAVLAADRLEPGGLLHVATDWAPYAEQVERVVADCPGLVRTEPPPRPRTRFELQGLAAGRPPRDVAATAAPTPR